MTIDEYIKNWLEENPYVEFTDELIYEMPNEAAEEIAKRYGNRGLMKLPSKEIEFFEWVKRNDPNVWDDLWTGDTLDNESYVITLNFLPLLKKFPDRGFPICDLLSTDNYYFTAQHMVDKESEMMVESVKQRFKGKHKLTLAQLLVLEISIDPIDIWHFAYKYKVNIDDAKEAAHELVEDGVLVHLKDADHLSSFIEF